MNEHRESDVDFIDAVRGLMAKVGHPTDKFNARQACFYTGRMLEVMSEAIAAIASGAVTPSDTMRLTGFADLLQHWAAEFKAGRHEGDILRCDHADLISAYFRSALVAHAACLSISIDAHSAFRHGIHSMLDRPSSPLDFEPYTDKTPRG